MKTQTTNSFISVLIGLHTFTAFVLTTIALLVIKAWQAIFAIAFAVILTGGLYLFWLLFKSALPS